MTTTMKRNLFCGHNLYQSTNKKASLQYIMSSTLLLRIAAAAYYCLLLANSTTMVAAEQLEAGGLRRRKVQSTRAVNRCGCMQCSDSIWSRPATDPVTLVSFTCGERIEYLISTGKSEEDACRKVAGEEFAVQCGRECNPNRCDGRYFVPNSVGSGSGSDSTFEVNTVTNDTPQYCFPEPSSRKTWDNVWGKYTVQGKTADFPSSHTRTPHSRHLQLFLFLLSIMFAQPKKVPHPVDLATTCSHPAWFRSMTTRTKLHCSTEWRMDSGPGPKSEPCCRMKSDHFPMAPTRFRLNK